MPGETPETPTSTSTSIEPVDESHEKDRAERRRMECVVNLKDLKVIAEKNLNAVKKTKFDQKMVMGISTFAFLFGTAFLTLNIGEKYVNAINLSVSFLSAGLSMTALITNVKNVLESKAVQSAIAKDHTIGPPEIDEKVAEVFVAKDIMEHMEEVKEVKRMIKERNEYLRTSNIYGSIVIIIGAAIATVLIGINIHYSLSRKQNGYFYEVNVLLIIGGIHCLFRSIVMHLALSSSDFFSRKFFKSFLYVFFIHLGLNCLIREHKNCSGLLAREKKREEAEIKKDADKISDKEIIKLDGADEVEKEKEAEKYRMSEHIVFFGGKLVYVRVSMTAREKNLINRLLHGLRLKEESKEFEIV